MWRFFARDERLGRDVLVVLVNLPSLEQADARAAFVEQARSLTRLRLPQLHTVLAVGMHKQHPYLVVEWVEGATLAVLLLRHQETPMRPAEALRILRPLQRAIDGQPADGIRRSLAPATVLLGEGFRILLTDLALDQLAGQPSQVVAVDAYHPPEYAGGQRGIAQDVYTLTAIAYQLLTGQPPTIPLPRASDCVPQLPAQVDAVLSRGLHPDPQQRPDSGRAVVAAIERALPPVSHAEQPLRAIIVDPDQTMQTFISSILEENFPELKIEAVEDGPSALASARERPVALMITGMHISGMTSLQLASAIRGLPEGHAAALVMLAVRTGKLDWSRLASIGANAILMKPFHPADLVQTIRRLYGLSPGDRQSAMGALTAVPGGLTPVAGRRVHTGTTGSHPVFVPPVARPSASPRRLLPLAILGGCALIALGLLASTWISQPAAHEPEVTPPPLAQNLEVKAPVAPQPATPTPQPETDETTTGGDEGSTTEDESDDSTPTKTRKHRPRKSKPADDELEAHDATPPASTTGTVENVVDTSSTPPEDASQTPRCKRIVETANEAMKLHDWNGVLRQLAKKECWPNALARQRLKTKSLMELGRFADCAKTGRSHPSAEVKSWVELCEQRGSEPG